MPARIASETSVAACSSHRWRCGIRAITSISPGATGSNATGAASTSGHRTAQIAGWCSRSRGVRPTRRAIIMDHVLAIE
jgi:hypothetical protein